MLQLAFAAQSVAVPYVPRVAVQGLLLLFASCILRVAYCGRRCSIGAAICAMEVYSNCCRQGMETSIPVAGFKASLRQRCRMRAQAEVAFELAHHVTLTFLD